MNIVHKLINSLIIFAFIAIILSFFLKKQIPSKEELLPEIEKSPIQNDVSKPDFSFDYRGTPYKVMPKTDYELWGLVVSHNNINSVADSYHNKESVDLKDICVVWGGNVKTGIYTEGKYSSGSWSCEWKFDSYESWRQFSEKEISNNHLISDDPIVQNQIRAVRIGDQVHLTGYLVDYVNGKTDWRRETSLTRKDTGNHACEVIFVNKLEILKPGNVIWYLMSYWGKIALAGLAVVKIVTMILESLFEAKKMDSRLTESGEA